MPEDPSVDQGGGKPTDETRGSRGVPDEVFVLYLWEWRAVGNLAEAELQELFKFMRKFSGGALVGY